MALKENDFIEVEYVGKVKGDDMVFDTTDEKLAKESGIHNPNASYGAVIICLGNGQLLKGLDSALVGKDVGQHTIEIAAEDGFGKKTAEMIQLIPTTKFKKEGFKPMVGMQINVDGMYGIVKSSGGGRTMVDFNHPLASKELIYDITVKKIVTDAQQKTEAFIRLALGMKDTIVTLAEGKATVTTGIELPAEAQKHLTMGVQKVVPEVKEIVYAVLKKE
jgi:FKBP-type peptidyl-prolyl cis-trans isomerase 2